MIEHSVLVAPGDRALSPIRLVRTAPELRELVAPWLAGHAGQALGIDSETNALDPWEIGFLCRTVQIASQDAAWVLDVHGIGPTAVAEFVRSHPFWVAHFSEAEVRYMGRGLPAPFDHESDTPPIVDLQVVQAWADPRTLVTQSKKDGLDPRLRLDKGLKPSTTRHISGVLEDAEREMHAWFREHAPKGSRTPKKATSWGFANVPLDEPAFVRYAGLDPIAAIRLWHHYVAEIKRLGKPWSSVYEDLCTQWDIDRATYRGMPVDPPYVRWLDAELRGVIEQATAWLAARGVPPSGMGGKVAQAFAALGEQPRKWTKGSETKAPAPSWDREALKAVIADGGPGAELAETLRRVRQAGKFHETYVQPMLASLDRDGRVHCSMRALGTVTGRMSAARPPIQQQPKKDTRVRAAFGAVPGWVVVSCDLSQGEPRTMAALSGDPNYVRAVMSGDINNATAQVAFGDAFNPAEGKIAGTTSYVMRQGTKAGFLAMCYSGGAQKVSDTIGVPLEHGRAIQDNWRTEYALMFGRSAQLNQGVSITLDNGWTIPLWDRFTVDDETGALLVRAQPSRKAMNYETQGQQKVYINRCWRELVRRGWSWALLMFMHDEILLLVPEYMAEYARRDLEEVMTFALPNNVTMLCEATIDGRTWLPQPETFALSELTAVEDE